MLVTCLISLVINVDGLNFRIKDQVQGKVIKQNSVNYIVDFSERALKYNWVGDYSRFLVKRSECL